MYNIIFYKENGMVLINFDTDLDGVKYIYNSLNSELMFIVVVNSMINKNSIGHAVIYDKDGNKIKWAEVV